MALVEVADEGLLRTITLSRPERRNAISNEMIDALQRVVDETARWPGAVVVLQGAGKSFCAGADLKSGSAPAGAWQARRVVLSQAARLVGALEELPQVTVARLHGHAIGGGLLLALACDLRVAEPDVVIRIPEIGLGLPFAMGGVPRLIREIGLTRARDAILTGRPIAIDEAVQWGIVHRVGDSLTETATLVEELLTAPTAVLSLTKQALHAAGRSVVSVDGAWADGDLVNLTALEPEGRERRSGG